jgi:membrane-bound lytic murein transglycosylase B
MRSQQLETAPETETATEAEAEPETDLGNLDDAIKLVASSFRALGWERLTAYGVTITLAGQADE